MSSDSVSYGLGDYVQLSKKRKGHIRFTGNIPVFGDCYGVELDAADSGGNDGSHNGHKYFDVKVGYGLFVRKTRIVKLLKKHEKKSSSSSPPPQILTTSTSNDSDSAAAKSPQNGKKSTPKKSASKKSPKPKKDSPIPGRRKVKLEHQSTPRPRFGTRDPRPMTMQKPQDPLSAAKSAGKAGNNKKKKQPKTYPVDGSDKEKLQFIFNEISGSAATKNAKKKPGAASTASGHKKNASEISKAAKIDLIKKATKIIEGLDGQQQDDESVHNLVTPNFIIKEFKIMFEICLHDKQYAVHREILKMFNSLIECAFTRHALAEHIIFIIKILLNQLTNSNTKSVNATKESIQLLIHEVLCEDDVKLMKIVINEFLRNCKTSKTKIIRKNCWLFMVQILESKYVNEKSAASKVQTTDKKAKKAEPNTETTEKTDEQQQSNGVHVAADDDAKGGDEDDELGEPPQPSEVNGNANANANDDEKKEENGKEQKSEQEHVIKKKPKPPKSIMEALSNTLKIGLNDKDKDVQLQAMKVLSLFSLLEEAKADRLFSKMSTSTRKLFDSKYGGKESTKSGGKKKSSSTKGSGSKSAKKVKKEKKTTATTTSSSARKRKDSGKKLFSLKEDPKLISNDRKRKKSPMSSSKGSGSKKKKSDKTVAAKNGKNKGSAKKDSSKSSSAKKDSKSGGKKDSSKTPKKKNGTGSTSPVKNKKTGGDAKSKGKGSKDTDKDEEKEKKAEKKASPKKKTEVPPLDTSPDDNDEDDDEKNESNGKHDGNKEEDENEKKEADEDGENAEVNVDEVRQRRRDRRGGAGQRSHGRSDGNAMGQFDLSALGGLDDADGPGSDSVESEEEEDEEGGDDEEENENENNGNSKPEMNGSSGMRAGMNGDVRKDEDDPYSSSTETYEGDNDIEIYEFPQKDVLNNVSSKGSTDFNIDIDGYLSNNNAEYNWKFGNEEMIFFSHKHNTHLLMSRISQIKASPDAQEADKTVDYEDEQMQWIKRLLEYPVDFDDLSIIKDTDEFWPTDVDPDYHLKLAANDNDESVKHGEHAFIMATQISYNLMRLLTNEHGSDWIKQFIEECIYEITVHALCVFHPLSAGNVYHGRVILEVLLNHFPRDFFKFLVEDSKIIQPLLQYAMMNNIHHGNLNSFVMDLICFDPDSIHQRDDIMFDEKAKMVRECADYKETLLNTVFVKKWQFIPRIMARALSVHNDDVSTKYSVFFVDLVARCASIESTRCLFAKHENLIIDSFVFGLLGRKSLNFWQRIRCGQSLVEYLDLASRPTIMDPSIAATPFGFMQAHNAYKDNIFYSSFKYCLARLIKYIPELCMLIVADDHDEHSNDKPQSIQLSHTLITQPLGRLKLNALELLTVTIDFHEMQCALVLQAIPLPFWMRIVEMAFVHKHNNMFLCHFRRLVHLSMIFRRRILKYLCTECNMVGKMIDFYQTEATRSELHGYILQMLHDIYSHDSEIKQIQQSQ